MPFMVGYGDVSRDGFHGGKYAVKTAVRDIKKIRITADFTAAYLP